MLNLSLEQQRFSTVNEYASLSGYDGFLIVESILDHFRSGNLSPMSPAVSFETFATLQTAYAEVFHSEGF